MEQMRKLKQLFRNVLIVTILLLSTGTLFAQGVFVTSVTPQPASVDFADTNFQMDLEVGLTLPAGVTTAEVKVTFPSNLEYVSVTSGAGAISVVRKSGDTDNKAPTYCNWYRGGTFGLYRKEKGNPGDLNRLYQTWGTVL